MAAASYNTDLSVLVDTETAGSWTGVQQSGGGAGVNATETDYFIEGSSCTSRNAWASAWKGMIEDATNNTLSTGSGNAVYTWVTHLTPASLGSKAVGGIRVIMGTGSGAYNEYYYAGSDTIDYGAPWICAIVNPDDATADSGAVAVNVMDAYGAIANLPSGGPTKGAPFGIDMIRYGRSIEINDGVGAQANFTDLAVQNDSQQNRWGQFQRTPGSTVNFTMQCRLEFGDTTNTTACDFSDTGKNITIADLEHVGTGFIEFDVTQASTVDISNCSFVATAGGNTLGNWVSTSSTLVTLTTNSFINMGTFGFDTNTTATGCTWRNCGLVTLDAGTLTDCVFDGSTNSPMLDADIATGTIDTVTGCNFIGDGTLTPGHAVDLGTMTTTQTVNWENTLDNGANQSVWAGAAGTTVGVSGTANDAILVHVNTGITLTIATTTSSTVPEVRNTGPGTVIITANTVTVQVEVLDDDTGLAIATTGHVYLLKKSDYSTVVLNAATNGSGIVQDTTYAYTVDEDVEGWVREMDLSGTDYAPANISGTIKSGGLFLTARLKPTS